MQIVYVWSHRLRSAMTQALGRVRHFRPASVFPGSANMTRFLSLRARLLLLVLLALVPLVVLVLMAGLEARHAEGRRAQEQAMQLVRLIARDQEQSINEARQFLITLAQLPALQARDADVCNRFMVNALNQYPRYANLGALTPEGLVFCSAQRFPSGTHATNSSWFRRALESRDFAMSDYHIGGITGRAVVTLAHAALDATGKVKAVAFASLDLEWLNRIVVEAQLPTGSVLTVIDREGRVLVRFPDPEFWIGESMRDTPLVQALHSQQSEGLSEALGPDRVKRLYAYRKLGPAPNVNSYVIIGIPKKVIYAESDHILRRNLSGLVLVISLAAAAAWWGGGLFLLRRIQAL